MTSSAEGKCPVCREEYKTPKILPCAHVICRDCFLSLLGERGHRWSCPLCREPILDRNYLDLEKHDSDFAVDAFPTDYAEVALAEGYRILNGRHVCGACDNDDHAAISFCFDCSMKLCQRCAASHSKFPAFKNHVTDLLSVLTAERLAVACQVTCSSHVDRFAELYCPAHHEPICTLCVLNHMGCGEVKNLSELARQERQSLKSQAQRLLNCGTAMVAKVSMQRCVCLFVSLCRYVCFCVCVCYRRFTFSLPQIGIAKV